MARPRKPIAECKGHKLTKAQRAQREAIEAASRSDVVIVPDYLEQDEREKFLQLAGMMVNLGRWNPVLSEHLARYVVAEETYQATTGQLREALERGDIDDAMTFQRMQNKAFSQATTAARLLGMTADDLRRMPLDEKAIEDDDPFGGF